MDNKLISEINEIRLKMGLNEIQNKNIFNTYKNVNILKETVTPKEEVIEAFAKWLGISFAKNLDEFGMNNFLRDNPITIEIPKIGGGAEEVICKSVDDLVAAAEKAQANIGGSKISDVLTDALSQNIAVRTKFSGNLARSKTNQAVSDFITNRNSTRSKVVTPKNTATQENIIQQRILDKINERLLGYDEVFSRKTDVTDNINPLLKDSDFKESGSDANFKLTNEVASETNESSASYFKDMSASLQERIIKLTNLKNANEEFFADLTNIVNSAGLKKPNEILESIKKAKSDMDTQATNAITNLTNAKKIADEAVTLKKEESLSWLRGGVERGTENIGSQTQSRAENIVRGSVNVLSMKDWMSVKVLEFVDGPIRAAWVGAMEGVGVHSVMKKVGLNPKDYDPKVPGIFGRLAKRHKDIMDTTLDLMDDIILTSSQNGVNPLKYKTYQEWAQNFLDTMFKGESRKAYSFDETERRIKGILNEMLEASQEAEKMRGVSVKPVGQRAATKEFNMKMGRLMAELKSVMKNTTKKRVYELKVDKNTTIQKVRKLEDLANEIETNLKELSETELSGAKELYEWFKAQKSSDGNLGVLGQLGKWLDDGALKMANDTTTPFRTFSFSMSDLFPFWGIIKNAGQSVDEMVGTARVRSKDPEAKASSLQQIKDISSTVKNVIQEKVGNLMTYGHFTNSEEIKRIFALHGPVKGALTISVRETVNHTLLVGVIESLREFAFFMDRFLCFTVDEAQQLIGSQTEEPDLKTSEPCITYAIISAYEAMGETFDNDRMRLQAAELNDRTRAELTEVVKSDLIGMLSDYRNLIVIPLFTDNALFAKQAFDAIEGATGLAIDETAWDKYMENEITAFEDTYGTLFTDLIQYAYMVISNPNPEYADSEGKKLIDKYKTERDRILNSGYIYTSATGSDVAIAAKNKEVEDVKFTINANPDTNFFPSQINNSNTVDLKGGKTIGLLDGFYSILTYPDEPTGEYTFKNGTKYDFDFEADGGYYSKHEPKAAEWFKENNFIGINDYPSGKFYRFYNRGKISLSELQNYYENGKLRYEPTVGFDPSSSGQYRFNTGRYYFLTPDGVLCDLIFLLDYISIDRLKQLIKSDDKKRRMERAEYIKNTEEEKIKKTIGSDLKKLKLNLAYVEKVLDEYENKGYDDEDSPFFYTYIRALTLRYGAKEVCEGDWKNILKNKQTESGMKWCANGKFWDQIEGKYVSSRNLQTQIDLKEKEEDDAYNKVDTEYDNSIKESKKSSNFENIINEYVYKNKMGNDMIKRTQIRHKMFESKRFDEDDYKHWKDTFKFQSIDEKNPGRYKDVRINMEDVMDRIDHFRKKYDEDDAFVRAVVDTHENVVRFMFTRDLANIKEGYEPSGFAKILLQLRESRGEMEIWSVSRPASGNWFLVKGDFTPKELAGMDLEKREPADKEPKKKENPVKTFKKKRG